MILLTGANGFLGRSISTHLTSLTKVITLGRSNCDIICDLSTQIPKLPSTFKTIIHCAGKAHVLNKNDKEKKDFFDVNSKGTQNLLSAINYLNIMPESFVLISTVAVYGLETGNLITEDHPLLAHDPYGLSKIQAEQHVITWCKKNNIICTILRLPLLAGTNPPGNLKTMIQGINKGYYFNIAGGKAKKSITLITDVARIIPIAAKIGGIYNLTDGYHPSFTELSTLIAHQIKKPIPRNMPYFIAKILAIVGDIVGEKSPINSIKLKKITADLTFDDNNARTVLGWKPTPVLKGLKL
jgi:nucleoside-diphosphate-sugar epimerase